jgi:hypothetical protein
LLWILWAIAWSALSLPALAKNKEQPVLVHGLWVWGTVSVLEEPGSGERLRDFCRYEGVNEVYISVVQMGSEPGNRRIQDLIALLHQSNIRVEALFANADADQPGKARDKLLDHIFDVIDFNRRNPETRFDGIHLDIEPQQRPENRGIKFMHHLVETYRKVRELADSDQMTVNADIPMRLIRADRKERKKLFSAIPRLTLMLYELSSPGDGESPEEKAAKLRRASQNALDTAYHGLHGGKLAKLSIALNTPDYGDLLPAMLQNLDTANRSNSHYLGWARHSYNAYLRAARLSSQASFSRPTPQ